MAEQSEISTTDDEIGKQRKTRPRCEWTTTDEECKPRGAYVVTTTDVEFARERASSSDSEGSLWWGKPRAPPSNITPTRATSASAAAGLRRQVARYLPRDDTQEAEVAPSDSEEERQTLWELWNDTIDYEQKPLRAPDTPAPARAPAERPLTRVVQDLPGDDTQEAEVAPSDSENESVIEALWGSRDHRIPYIEKPLAAARAPATAARSRSTRHRPRDEGLDPPKPSAGEWTFDVLTPEEARRKILEVAQREAEGDRSHAPHIGSGQTRRSLEGSDSASAANVPTAESRSLPRGKRDLGAGAYQPFVHTKRSSIVSARVERSLPAEDSCRVQDGEYQYLRNLHPLMKDDDVTFEEEGHKYTIKSTPHIEYTSTTTFWGSFVDPFPRVALFATKKALEKRYAAWCSAVYLWIAEVHKGRRADGDWPNPYRVHKTESYFWNESLHELISEERFKEIAFAKLRGKSLEAFGPLPPPDDGDRGGISVEQISASWTRRGTELHADIERYLNRCPFEGGEPRTKEWFYFKRFLSDYAHWDIVRTEVRIYDSALRICGSVDALAKVTGEEDSSSYIMIDWKRSKRLGGSPAEDTILNKKPMNPPFDMLQQTDMNKYALQQNMYKYILERNYGIRVSSMYLCILHPKNEDYILRTVQDFSSSRRLSAAFTSALETRRREVSSIG